jgi:hypothetical protein
MIEELGRHGYRISPGTLYPLLHNLEKKGYLRVIQQVSCRQGDRHVVTAVGGGGASERTAALTASSAATLRPEFERLGESDVYCNLSLTAPEVARQDLFARRPANPINPYKPCAYFEMIGECLRYW